MRIEELFENGQHKKKYLIVSNIQRGNALLRLYEQETNKSVNNVVPTTLQNIINELYYSLLANNTIKEEKRILNNKEGEMFFHELLLELSPSLLYFNDQYMLNIATTNEIYQKINLIRLNGWINEEKENDRLEDLKTIIHHYEEELNANHYLDRVEILKVVLKHFDSVSNENDYYCIKEDLEQLSHLECELINRLNVKDSISYFENDTLKLEDLNHLKDSISFFRGNGVFNEVMYVVYDIAKNKIPLGDVTLLYTNSSQAQVVSSVLSANNIANSFVSSKPSLDNPYYSLVRRIFAWAREDYSEKQLERILASSILYAEDVETKQNLLEGDMYYDSVLRMSKRFDHTMILGWGYERNKAFIEQARTLEEKLIPIYDLHQDLLNIFEVYEIEDEGIPSELLDRIITFIRNHTIDSKEKSKAINELYREKDILSFTKRKLSLEESIELIADMLEGTRDKEKESSSAIRCEQVSSWTILNRPYVYMIGLSLKDLLTSTTESPVLTDEEMEKKLMDGYKPTIQTISKLREQNSYRTLKTFGGKKVTLGYSSFDAQAFFRSNPSFFYKDMLQYFKGMDVNQIDEFVVGNPEEGVWVDKCVLTESDEPFKIKLPTSSSSAEVFVDCPRRYAYERVLRIPDDEYREYDSTGWLNAAERGTFFHALMERYINQELILSGNKEYPDYPNEEKIESIAQELKEESLNQTPVAFEGIAEDETNNLIEYAKDYFRSLYQSLKETGWRMLSCEQDFQNAEYKVKSLHDKEYVFKLRGSIDRVDYKVLSEEKKVLIRVSDYKTGRKEKKEQSDERGVLLQYDIYKTALMDTGKTESGEPVLEHLKKRIVALEGDKELENYSYSFDSFRYEFPVDPSADGPIEITFEDEPLIEPLNIKRLRYVLTVIEDMGIYPDVYTLETSLNDYKKQYPKDVFDDLIGTFLDKDVSACTYCSYADMCEKRKAGVI